MSTRAPARLSRTPARIALLYLAFGLSWIWLSDLALVGFGFASGDGHGYLAAAGKGTAFVAVTAALLFWLVRREVAAVRASASLLRAVVEGTTDAVYVKDRRGKYLLFNEAAARFVGKPAEAVLGQDDTYLFDAESAARVMELDQQLMANNRTAIAEETVAAGGVTRTYLSTKAPCLDTDGRVIGVVGISHDVTDRKRVDVELRAAERRFRDLGDAIPQIVWTAGPDGGLTSVNAQAAAYSGIGADAVLGWSWQSSIHPEDWPQALASWTETLTTGVPRDIELRLRRADGAFRWHVSRQVPARDAAGTVTGWYGTCTDIDDLKRAAEALRVRTDLYLMLAHTNRAVGRCLGAAELYQELCQIAVETGHFLFAWVGVPDGDRVRVVARAGDDGGYLDEVVITLAPDDSRSRGPLGRAAGSGQPFIVNDFLAADLTAPWHDPARRVGIAASAGFPLFENGRVAAVLNLYAPTPGFFTAELVAALSEITPNVSFALDGFVRDRERKRTVEQRDELLARLQLHIERMPIAYVLYDADIRYADWNPAAETIFGYSRDEILGQSLHFLVHPDDRVHLDAISDRLRAGDVTAHSVNRNVTKDGRVITCEWHNTPLSSPTGAFLGVLSMVTDVTQRERAETALRESEERLNFALSAAEIGDWDMDLRTNVARRSLRHDQCFGYAEPVAEWGYETFLAHVQRVDRDRVDATYQRALAGEGEYDVEFRADWPDGSPHWLWSKGRFYFDGNGRPYRVAGIQVDITDRKRAEQALRESEERLRLALTAGRMGTFDWDLATDAVVWSDTHYELLGYPPGDRFPVEYRHFADRIHPDDLPAVERRIREAKDTAGQYRSEARARLPDGTIRWIMATGEFQYENGRPVRMLGTVVDITARKDAEAALELRDRAIQAVMAGVVITDSSRPDDPILYVSRGFERMSGYAAAEVLGRNCRFLQGPDTDPAGVARVRRAIAAGTPCSVELVNYRKDGTPYWNSLTLAPIADAGGRVTHFVGVQTDVSERKRAEAVIRESEEKYRRLVDLLPTAIFVHADDAILYVNPAFLRMMGVTDAAELLARSPYAVAPPDEHDAIRRRHEEMARTGAAVPGFEMRVLRPDGRSVPVYSVAAPVPGYGKPAILVVLSDLTERERSMALLRSVLGSVNDAILTIDERGTVGSANPAAVRQFGYAEDELVGENVNVLMPEPYHAEHDDYLGNYLRTGVAKVIGIGREVEGRRRDGTRFPAELTVTEFRLDGQRHFTGVLRDITERKRLEAQFLQAQKMEAVGRLAGGIAHDFNNLLTVINGYGELLLMELPAGDPGREPVAAIREAGGRAARLTQQLLAYSRKAIVEPKVLDLSELVRESAKLLRPLIGEDVIVSVVTGPTPVRVRADPGQLEQVVMNLVVNARDAMPAGGRLTIETATVAAADGDPTPLARLSVTDTGQGMTDEVKAKLFEPFFTTKGVGKGTGLGLAVVHGVVEHCGGRVAVESAVGVGTTFRLLFPLVAGGADGAGPETAPLATRGTETVLLVEDEDAVRMIARISLETQGYSVLEANGGAEAMRLAETYPGGIDLLVSDVVMPEMGGRQLLEAVRRHRPGLRVLFMSGHTDDAVLLQGVGEATGAFIQKPFTPLALARKVRELIDAAVG